MDYTYRQLKALGFSESPPVEGVLPEYMVLEDVGAMCLVARYCRAGRYYLHVAQDASLQRIEAESLEDIVKSIGLENLINFLKTGEKPNKAA